MLSSKCGNSIKTFSENNNVDETEGGERGFHSFFGSLSKKKQV
jgi:hypothetical protein